MSKNNEKFAITIGRQFCSGGHVIGEKLAEKLNIKFYDKELIALASKESGFSEKVFEKADEKPTNSFLYSVAIGSYPVNSMFFQHNDLLTNDKLFITQSKVIKKIAAQNSCVILGRCSDYVLREEKKLVRVFLRADMEFRIERFKKLFSDNLPKDITAQIIKTDKKRASYYSYYTGNEWSSLENYDLIINTSKIGFDNTVDQIINFLNLI